MFIKIFLLGMLTLSLNAKSLKNTTYPNIIVSEVTSIYDGDTFRANIKGYPAIIGNHIGIRINGIDTPEIRGKCEKEKVLARKAKQLTVSLLRGAKRIELRNLKRGKYFRIIADVYVDGQNIAKTLLSSNLATKYDGKKKTRAWCK